MIQNLKQNDYIQQEKVLVGVKKCEPGPSKNTAGLKSETFIN